jgi:acyl-CoA thioester hydrolase
MTLPFRHEVSRRYSDIDQQQHVNNVVYFSYVQDARIALLFSAWQANMHDLHHVVVHQQMSYRKPLVISLAPVVVEVWVSDIGNSSYVLSYRLIDEHGDLAAESTTTMACIDPSTGRATRVPDDLRALLEGLRITA